MNEPNSIAEKYLALWNDGNDASRRDRLRDGWTADSRYTDPVMSGEGHDGIATMIAAARERFPGHGFRLAGTPDGHGPFVRFSWSLAPGDGLAIAHGMDVVRLDEKGRIAEVIGFLDGMAA